MRFTAIILAFWALVSPAVAQDKTAIQGVITDQLEAFNDRDIDQAWTHASPMIQNMFGNPGNFGRMVENGYPMVWDNSDRRFEELEGSGGLVSQKVYVRDADGNGWILSYTMLQTDAGWKINGVSVIPAPELAA